MARGRKRSSKKQQHAAIEPEGKGLSPKHNHHGSSKVSIKKKVLPRGRLDNHLTLSPESCSDSAVSIKSKSLLDFCHEFSHTNGDEQHGVSGGNRIINKRSSLPEISRDNFEEARNFDSPQPEPKFDKGFESSSDSYTCKYCGVACSSDFELKLHCQTDSHQAIVMSDAGREWRYRPPPRGYTSNGYSLCEKWDKVCKYGDECVEAHSPEELQEWHERYEYRQKKIHQAEEQNLLKKSYTEHLLERWSNTSNPDTVLKEKVDYAEDSVCENQLTTTVSKDSPTDWTFLIKTSRKLQAIALLQYQDRNHFSIRSIKSTNGGLHKEWVSENKFEWILSDKRETIEASQTSKKIPEYKHSVCIEFLSDIYGTFRQTVAFDFGKEPLLVKHLCVDVRPAAFATNVEELKKELFLEERWDETNAEIIKFSSSCDGPIHDIRDPEELLRKYPAPTPSTFTLTQSTVTERTITRNNYCSRMHELLGVEEMARYQQVARYNVRSKLSVTKSYLLAPAGTAHSTAKFAQDDFLYAVMKLSQAISEDTAAGRLILNNCTSVLLCLAGKSSQTKGSGMKKKKVFEAIIEDKGKNVIYLKLSPETVKSYNICGGTEIYAEVQFQLNRLQYCEWHHAVDSISDYKILFPETFIEPDIPWTPQRQWKEIKETRLNVKQKEAVVAISTPLTMKLPPILIIGPFGTGKTYTLAQAIKQLLTDPSYRILVCTHSNSAADIYINDYLHPYVESGHTAARPLRIYYHKRWVSTVNPTVLQYCLTENVMGVKRFKIPEKKDIENHRVVVVTLNMSMVLATLGLNKGFFTHIFLDEAAQAMECEAIMPLALAGEETRIVLAGDHMQLNPELFSPFAKERNLQMSLLERLYDHYPTSFPCKILLTENYRAHEAIIKFTSDLFYDQKLVSSGRQPRHPNYYPLTFYSCRGEDVQEINSTGHYNLAEVYEVAERVSALRQSWPAEWGELNEQSIGIVTPYADQVFRIRCELRRKKLGSISVERVLNVQGKQFRAIFISTVRTRRTCTVNNKGYGNEDNEYGFLSNSKLLNTAITRAQSLVAVVGDPVALCSLGRCRKVWERYLKTCDDNKSLFGIPWASIQAELDGVEFRLHYGLNPLAPEFVPMGLHPYQGNDAFVFNGFQSQFSFFDQEDGSGASQTAPPYQNQNHMPGSPDMPVVEGGTSNNFHHPQYVAKTRAQLQLDKVDQTQQSQLQRKGHWTEYPYIQFCILNQGPTKMNQTHQSIVQKQKLHSPKTGPLNCIPYPQNPNPTRTPYVTIDYSKIQPTPEVIETSAPVCGSSTHFMNQDPRLLSGSDQHLAPLMRIPASMNAEAHFQLMPTNVGQHIETYSSLQGNQTAHLQAVNSSLPSRQPAFPSQLPCNTPPGMLQQLAQAQGLQNSLPNLQAAQTLPNGLIQQSVVQNQHHQIPMPSPQSAFQHLHQEQQHLQQIHLQQLHQQQFRQQQLHQLHQQQLQQQQLQQQQLHQQQEHHTPYNQIPLQHHLQPNVPHQFLVQDQQQLQMQQLFQQQQNHQLKVLLEQRKFLLGHILTPLVNCNPEWSKLVPRGVNLLDLVDNKSQQRAWWNHLMSNGQTDVAKKFENFMGLCIRTITAVVDEHKHVSADSFIGRSETFGQNRKPCDTTEISGKVISCSSTHEMIISSGTSQSNGPDDGVVKTQADKEINEPVIMMKDLDPSYMLGSDPFLNGGKSVWAIAQDELKECTRSGGIKNHNKLPTSPQAKSYDTDDSGDELLSSINRQLHLQQSDE